MHINLGLYPESSVHKSVAKEVAAAIKSDPDFSLGPDPHVLCSFPYEDRRLNRLFRPQRPSGLNLAHQLSLLSTHGSSLLSSTQAPPQLHTEMVGFQKCILITVFPWWYPSVLVTLSWAS